jgi:hypothetical protein
VKQSPRETTCGGLEDDGRREKMLTALRVLSGSHKAALLSEHSGVDRLYLAMHINVRELRILHEKKTS